MTKKMRRNRNEKNGGQRKRKKRKRRRRNTSTARGITVPFIFVPRVPKRREQFHKKQLAIQLEEKNGLISWKLILPQRKQKLWSATRVYSPSRVRRDFKINSFGKKYYKKAGFMKIYLLIYRFIRKSRNVKLSIKTVFVCGNLKLSIGYWIERTTRYIRCSSLHRWIATKTDYFFEQNTTFSYSIWQK